MYHTQDSSSIIFEVAGLYLAWEPSSAILTADVDLKIMRRNKAEKNLATKLIQSEVLETVRIILGNVLSDPFLPHSHSSPSLAASSHLSCWISRMTRSLPLSLCLGNHQLI